MILRKLSYNSVEFFLSGGNSGFTKLDVEFVVLFVLFAINNVDSDGFPKITIISTNKNSTYSVTLSSKRSSPSRDSKSRPASAVSGTVRNGT